MIDLLNYKRNLILYYTFVFLSSLWIFNTILVLYYQANNLTFTQIGALSSILAISIVLLEIPSGAFADLIGRKWSIIIAQSLLAIYLLILIFNPTFLGFIFAAIIFGVSYSFISGAKEALLYDTLKKLKKTQEHIHILGKEHFLFAIAGVFSAYLGPTLFNINITYPIYLSLIFIILSLFVAFFFVEPSKKGNYTLKEHYNQISSSIYKTINNNKLLWIIAFTIISAVGFTIFINMTLQPYIIEIGFSLTDMAYILVASSLIGAFTSLFYGRLESFLGEKKSMFALIISQTLIFFMIGYFTFKINVIFLILFGVVRGYQGMIMNHYSNKHIESKERATILSISSFSYNLFAAIFVFLIGLIITSTSIGIGHLVTGSLVTIIGLTLLFFKYRK